MKKNPFLPALILGAAVAVLSALFPKAPILEMEFARDAGEVFRIVGFGTVSDAGPNPEIVQAIRDNVAHDRWFIFAYVLFLALSCAVVWRISRSWPALAGLILAMAAGAFDFGENRQILLIINQIDKADFSEALGRLHVFTWLKWGSIALVFCALAPFAWKRGFRGKMLAALSVLTAATGLVAVSMQYLPVSVAFAYMVTALFLLLFVFELLFKESVWK
jgi:hypothetical protein